MSSAIEVLKEWVGKPIIFDERFMTGEEYLEQFNLKVAVKEVLLVLEQKEKLIKHCNELETNNTNEISKTMFGALIGTCKVKEILGIKEREVKK